MKAIVLHGPGDLRIEEVPRPSPRGGEVLVKVRAAGVCSSDIRRVRTGNVRRLPLVLGHEIAGVVVEVGEGVSVEVGTRVAVYPLLWCGRCESCRQGIYQCCSDYSYHGSRTAGGWAEFILTRAANLVALPDELSDEEGAMIEPAAVAQHGLNRAELQQGERIAIIGAGTIGLLVAQVARACGAESVVILDLLQERLALAKSLGFDKLICVGSGDVVDKVKALAGGKLPQVVIEAAGTSRSYNLAIDLAAPGGRVVFIGEIDADLEIPRERVSSILRKELQILGSWNSSLAHPENDWQRVLQLALCRQIKLTPLIFQRLSLPDLPECLRKLHNRHAPTHKIMMTFAD